MARRDALALLFWTNLLVVVLLGSYKVYLILFTEDFSGSHAEQRARIEETLKGAEEYRFAVVGNINNSIGIFERKIVPMLNARNPDFLVSAGNATSGGGEDKYQSLHGTLKRLEIPWLLTFGPQEGEGFGSFHFYRHLGPYYYDIVVADSLFLFLDSTGKTSFEWQLRWLEQRLRASDARHIFLFTGRPIRPVPHEELLVDDDYLLPMPFRQRLRELIRAYDVSAVFAANMPLYHHQRIAGTHYVVTGGAGGLVINQDNSVYHYVNVAVDDSGVSIEPATLEIGQHPVGRTLESFWFFVYSLFYVGFGNFLLILSALVVLALWLYRLIFTERHYYPDYDLEPADMPQRKLRVAMFTNNYLPFVGGVPIAIARLREGLEQLGHQVLLVAPDYRDNRDSDSRVVRLSAPLRMGPRREFPIANPFSARLRRRLRTFEPDLIHVHHPFWLGSLGLFVARRRRLPVVYTYHTRLEHYAHFVPLPGALFRNLISHSLVRRFANRCQAVVVPTQAAEEYLRMIGVRSATFIQPTGIEYERFATVDPARVEQLRRRLGLEGKRVLISVSRLSREKNIDFMLEALADWYRNGDEDFRLLLIGDGQQREQLRRRIEELGLTDQVLMLGAIAREEIALYYHLAELFVFASRSETQGMVILEAMASGLPVVAVRSSGIDDTVQDGHNGFKTPLNQGRWSRAVQTLMEDEALRVNFAANARDFARRHSVAHFATAMTRVYAHALASHSARNR